MGKPSIPVRGMLFCGLLYTQEDYYWYALRALVERYGEVLFYSPPLQWNFSNYYKQELGDDIKRRYLFFDELIDLDRLAEIKLTTNQIEQILSIDNKRTVNIDPGYLTEAKVVLASTKDYSHRIYLKDGIFAEVTLIYKKGNFVPHINTYSDYCTKSHQFYFHIARQMLKDELRNAVNGFQPT